MLLARIARNLTHHWVRGLLGALAVLVLLGFAAQSSGEAVDDFSAPGTETQAALDLFKAHTPALAGADSTLVFSVEDGKITDPAQRAAVEGALAKVKELPGVAQGRGSVRRGRRDLPGRPAGFGRRPLHHRPGRDREVRRRGAAGRGGDRRARRRRVLRARHAGRPRLRAGGAGRRARRRRGRDPAADAAVPLAGGDGGDGAGRADRRHGRPDPARRAGRAARSARVRVGDRDDARTGGGDRLLAADHRALPRADRGRGQPP